MFSSLKFLTARRHEFINTCFFCIAILLIGSAHTVLASFWSSRLQKTDFYGEFSFFALYQAPWELRCNMSSTRDNISSRYPYTVQRAENMACFWVYLTNFIYVSCHHDSICNIFTCLHDRMQGTRAGLFQKSPHSSAVSKIQVGSGNSSRGQPNWRSV